MLFLTPMFIFFCGTQNLLFFKKKKNIVRQGRYIGWIGRFFYLAEKCLKWGSFTNLNTIY